jgi:TolA-binding protein
MPTPTNPFSSTSHTRNEPPARNNMGTKSRASFFLGYEPKEPEFYITKRTNFANEARSKKRQEIISKRREALHEYTKRNIEAYTPSDWQYINANRALRQTDAERIAQLERRIEELERELREARQQRGQHDNRGRRNERSPAPRNRNAQRDISPAQAHNWQKTTGLYFDARPLALWQQLNAEGVHYTIEEAPNGLVQMRVTNGAQIGRAVRAAFEHYRKTRGVYQVQERDPRHAGDFGHQPRPQFRN